MKELIDRVHLKARRPILACGSDMKSSYVLAKGGRACLVGDFGDLQDPDNLSRYEKSIKANSRSLHIAPKIVACDLHPSYISTRFAENYFLPPGRVSRRQGRRTMEHGLYRVQHHEAHIASCMVDHGIRGDVIGIAFDGTGYGTDGNIWGGEFFAGGLRAFKRVGRFEYMPMPGGEMAIREPWRMAAACLYRAFGGGFTKLKIDFTRRMDKGKWKVLKTMIDKGINAPLTSSAGRLFDAASSLVIAKDRVSREAEGPMELERMADGNEKGFYGFRAETEGGIIIIKSSGTIRAMVKDLSHGVSCDKISARFHNTVAEAARHVSSILRRRYGIKRVVLTGGVFQNRFLDRGLRTLLKKSGFEVFAHSGIPANDLGIPVGQAAIADARARCA